MSSHPFLSTTDAIEDESSQLISICQQRFVSGKLKRMVSGSEQPDCVFLRAVDTSSRGEKTFSAAMEEFERHVDDVSYYKMRIDALIAEELIRSGSNEEIDKGRLWRYTS